MLVGMIQTIADGVRSGELDPVELTRKALARAAESAELNAIVHLDPDGALRAAAEVKGGRLAGVPLLVKEIIMVAELPYPCGSARCANQTSAGDAEIVRRARAEGAVIIGLSHSHEFAYGCTGTSNVTGPCRNPHDPSRITGGSSSGSSAAVAAGVVPLALGTDTAGSVRIPAALCGAVGVMPSRGTFSSVGVFPLSASLDRVGVLTTSVADARYAVAALAGLDLPPASPTPPRLGVVTNPDLLDCSTEVTAAYRAALDGLATANLVDVRVSDWTALADVAFDLQGPEAAAVHIGSLDGYQPDVIERLRVAREVPGWRYVEARRLVDPMTAALGRLLSTVDAIVLPTSPIVAPPIGADTAEVASGIQPVRDLLLRNNRPVNVTPYPALSVPIPSPGLPVGLQLIATDDATAFAAAEWVESVLRAGSSR
jgi:aspartyl-tRNA(Asn)/glutamyl-tRNA(Gln) amidotransferase subunit A